jgi:hypothetical protein
LWKKSSKSLHQIWKLSTKNQNLTNRFSSQKDRSQWNEHFFFYIRVFSEVKNKPLCIRVQVKKEERKKKQTNKTNKPHRTSQLPSTLLLISHLSEALSLQSSTKRQNTQIVKLDSFLCVSASKLGLVPFLSFNSHIFTNSKDWVFS